MNDLFADHYPEAPGSPPTPVEHLAQNAADAFLLKRQQAVVAMGRRAVALPDLSVLTQDAAQLVAEMLEADYGAVAEYAPGSDSIALRVVRRIGDAQGTVQSFRLPVAGGASLAGYTLNGRQAVVIDDLAQEKRFDDSLLRRLQVRSALSIPLALHECAFGVLSVLSTARRTFDAQDVCFAESVAHLLTTAMARKRTEDLLVGERRAASAVLDTVDALVLELDREGRIRTINRAGQASSGFGLEGLRGRPMWSVFCTPEEAKGLQAALGCLENGCGSVEYESVLVTKHAERRRIAWTCGTVRDRAGHVESIIATGIDVTDRSTGEATLDEEPVDALIVAPDGSPSSPPPAPVGRDRRTQPRKPYPYQQMIAPMIGKRLPSRNEFAPVTCHDISPGGFSFMAQTPPESDEFVVALGCGATLTYVIAQVAHMRRFEQDGDRRFLVGCNYVGRADY